MLLKRSGPLSVADLSAAMGITEMAVRRHIQTLERDGLLQAALTRQKMGRPMYLYTLSPLADDLFPKNYNGLALDLLEELEQEEGPEVVTRLFVRRKLKLQRMYGERMSGKALEARVAELADIQNAGGYMAEWEKGEQGGSYILREYNCPISKVAGRYEQACECELKLFEELLGADVERTECLAKGGCKCVYVIREKRQLQSAPEPCAQSRRSAPHQYQRG